MGRLFWKFFLTFWLALLVAGIGVGTAVWLRHNAGQGEEAGQLVDVGHAALFVAVSENIIRHGGVAGLFCRVDPPARRCRAGGCGLN